MVVGRIAHRGVPKIPVGVVKPGRISPGIPAPFWPVSSVIVLCAATTKAGNACKARPVAGSQVCVGHARQVKADE